MSTTPPESNHEAYISFDHEHDDGESEQAPWELCIPSPDGNPYVRRAWSPEPLVRAALKWGRDRNTAITVIVWANRGDV